MSTMKKLFILSCCIFMGTFCVFGADTINRTANLSVNYKFPPQARTSGTSGISANTAEDNWLNIELKFRTADVKDIKARFLDNAELDVRVIARDDNKVIMFKGIVKYWYIEQDGKDHYMKALLPAPIFHRYSNGTNITKFRFYVRAELRANGKPLAIIYSSSRSVPQKEVFAAFRNMPKNILTIDNSIRGRNGTTWSIIEVNKYEYEKDK